MIGQSVHPEANAGDGKVIEQSVSIKKTDPMDRRIQCAQCGFYVDLDTRATGDSLGAITAPESLTTETITPPGPGIAMSDTFADPIDTNSGCPFCNSMNPQGKRRDALFGTGVNLENQ